MVSHIVSTFSRAGYDVGAESRLVSVIVYFFEHWKWYCCVYGMVHIYDETGTSMP